MPLISIIVPIYNAESTINRCVDSILGQSFTDFELLLINDGSTDGTLAICEEYANLDKRVRVFRKANGGANSARNVGLENVKGTWITFCDSDDYVLDCWLENFVSQINEDVSLIVQGLISSGPISLEKSLSKKRYHGVNFIGSVDALLVQLLLICSVGYMVCKLFRFSIIRDNDLRFNEHLKYREDEEYVLRYMTYCNNVSSIEKAGYYYFSPEWTNKYSYSSEDFNRDYSCYNSACKILKNKYNSFLKEYYFENLSRSLFLSYKYREPDTIVRLRKYRDSVWDIILSTRLFTITKWAIYLDKSCYIANRILKMHVKLKPCHE